MDFFQESPKLKYLGRDFKLLVPGLKMFRLVKDLKLEKLDLWVTFNLQYSPPSNTLVPI